MKIEKENIVNKLNFLSTAIVEMMDNADQRIPALSRKEVANLLNNKDVYDENGYLEYGPGLSLTHNQGEPWLLDVSYSDENELDVDEALIAQLSDLLDTNITNGEEIEIELNDGNLVYIDADVAKDLYEADPVLFINSLSDINTFIDEFGIDADISIKEGMTNYVDEWLYSLVENDSKIGQTGGFNRHRRKVGRKIIRNRIIAGKTQYKVQRSGQKGFKISGDSVVRIKPAEARKRKIGARIAARKRRAKMSQIVRRRARSNRIRAARFGE